ncbi:response regulator [Nonomuraea angiospora]|uniref:response regulator transcription factor n=1 Tax=Nonomuraea angiospora TaxID=46172 RepID=UPI0029AC5BA7|nr:response regulator transcription factor [Nonomuraea angiospora]MDX3099809.1 response regulator transcription factor [Nonomuraea angiospora]
MNVRVLIVDDQVLMREGLRKLLEMEEGIEIAGEAADGLAALDLLASMAPGALPDVALVDARMPRMDGIELIRRLDVPSIILTTFDDDDYIFGGLRAGARGYLLKDTPPNELVAAIGKAARGEMVLGGVAAERVVAELHRTPAAPGPMAELSEREHEVAVLVGDGATNREIARRLFITEGTTKNHISSILRKLGLRDRTQLAIHVSKHRVQ